MTAFNVLKSIADNPTEIYIHADKPLRRSVELFFKDSAAFTKFGQVLALVSNRVDTDAALGAGARDDDLCTIEVIDGDTITHMLAHLAGPERPCLREVMDRLDGPDEPGPWDPSI